MIKGKYYNHINIFYIKKVSAKFIIPIKALIMYF